ncbi:MAG: GH116 family glycosyl-hydrolase [Halobacteriales archaeon]
MADDSTGGSTPTAEFDGRGREFSGADTEVAFPLGGIGTGNVSLDARGGLRDWELFNRPSKGNELPFSFFALRCERGGESTFRVLESGLQPPYVDHYGYDPETTFGLPRFDDATFRGEYPVATVDLEDEDVPLDVSLTAYTPFVPLDPEASGIPVAVFEYSLSNPTDGTVEASVAGSLGNPAGHREELTPRGHRNAFREDGDVAGIHFTTDAWDPDALGYAEAALTTLADEGVSHTATWDREGHWNGIRAFTEDFRADGRLTPNTYEEPPEPGETDAGSLAVATELAPGEERTVRFLVSWYVPNRPQGWDQSIPADGGAGSACCAGDDDDAGAGDDDGETTEDGATGNDDGDTDDGAETIRNHYATRFADAWDVAGHVADEFDRLRERTFAFRDAFYGSTVPGSVLEAAGNGMAAMRSPVCMWLEDGAFLAWEGGHCCFGTCTHVWNYAWTLAALFPSLEREMRRIDFEEGTDDGGYMTYRTPYPFDVEDLRAFDDDHPALDGQMGSILRLYREWTRSGDDEFLDRLWPAAKRALEFAFAYEEWDPDADGVLSGTQHNTYDVEFVGANPLSQSWYLAALRAGAEMARAMGADEAADRYESVLREGREHTGERLFNGTYYEQEASALVEGGDDDGTVPHQHGRGCLSDQVIGQWYADRLDLGDVLPPDGVESALDAVYRHNFREDLSEHLNHGRSFALADDPGLVLCSWPEGGKPDRPFWFAEEVWTGIEYQVASHLLSRGRVEKGLELVRAVRTRHDGRRRNPWNEFECGPHYARAGASWAVYEALCGLTVDLRDEADLPEGDTVEVSEAVNDHGFAVDPAIEADPFRCFWVTGDAWGTCELDGSTGDGAEIEVLYRDGR